MAGRPVGRTMEPTLKSEQEVPGQRDKPRTLGAQVDADARRERTNRPCRPGAEGRGTEAPSHKP